MVLQRPGRGESQLAPLTRVRPLSGMPPQVVLQRAPVRKRGPAHLAPKHPLSRVRQLMLA
jgi:hypothetical protein